MSFSCRHFPESLQQKKLGIPQVGLGILAGLSQTLGLLNFRSIVNLYFLLVYAVHFTAKKQIGFIEHLKKMKV